MRGAATGLAVMRRLAAQARRGQATPAPATFTSTRRRVHDAHISSMARAMEEVRRTQEALRRQLLARGLASTDTGRRQVIV